MISIPLARLPAMKTIIKVIILAFLCFSTTFTFAEMAITGYGSTVNEAIGNAFDSARSACPFGFIVKREGIKHGSNGGMICTLVIECNS